MTSKKYRQANEEAEAGTAVTTPTTTESGSDSVSQTRPHMPPPQQHLQLPKEMEYDEMTMAGEPDVGTPPRPKHPTGRKRTAAVHTPNRVTAAAAAAAAAAATAAKWGKESNREAKRMRLTASASNSPAKMSKERTWEPQQPSALPGGCTKDSRHGLEHWTEPTGSSPPSGAHDGIEDWNADWLHYTTADLAGTSEAQLCSIPKKMPWEMPPSSPPLARGRSHMDGSAKEDGGVPDSVMTSGWDVESESESGSESGFKDDELELAPPMPLESSLQGTASTARPTLRWQITQLPTPGPQSNGVWIAADSCSPPAPCSPQHYHRSRAAARRAATSSSDQILLLTLASPLPCDWQDRDAFLKPLMEALAQCSKGGTSLSTVDESAGEQLAVLCTGHQGARRLLHNTLWKAALASFLESLDNGLVSYRVKSLLSYQSHFHYGVFAARDSR